MSLINIPNGSSVNAENLHILDENFEYMRVRYNSFVDRINPYFARLKAPYNKEPLTYILEDDLIILTDKLILTAEDLNATFDLFKNRLLALGVKKLTKGDDDITDIELLVPQLPKAPSNLLGSPELYNGDGTCTLELTWHDNADNEAGFEVYQYTTDQGWGSKESIPYHNAELTTTNITWTPVDLVETPAEITFFPNFKYKVRSFNNLGYSDFSNEWAMPVPTIPNAPSNLVGNLNIGTITEGLTWSDNSNNEAGFEVSERVMGIWSILDYPVKEVEFYETHELQTLPEYALNDYLLLNSEYILNYGWRVRAWNGIGYSPYSNTAEYASLPQPNISDLTLYPENINLELNTYQNHDIVTYQEVWAAYSPNSLEGFIDTPYQLVYKSEVLDGELVFDWTIPEPNISNNEMLNQYAFFKVRAYSPIMRSSFSSLEGKILPPKVPTGLSVSLNDFYYQMGGDMITEVRWENNSGDDTEIEFWGKWGSGDWELLDTSGGTWFGWVQDSGSRPIGFNHNIGMHPRSKYHYKVRAINDSGESEFSEECSIDTFAPNPPYNASATLTWITGTHDYTVVLNWTNGDPYSETQIERKIDSGSYLLLTTLTGSPTTYNDHIGIPSATHTYYYRIRGNNT